MIHNALYRTLRRLGGFPAAFILIGIMALTTNVSARYNILFDSEPPDDSSITNFIYLPWISAGQENDDISAARAAQSHSCSEAYRYIRLVALSEVRSRTWTTIGEFNLVDGDGRLLDQSSWTLPT